MRGPAILLLFTGLLNNQVRALFFYLSFEEKYIAFMMTSQVSTTFVCFFSNEFFLKLVNKYIPECIFLWSLFVPHVVKTSFDIIFTDNVGFVYIN